MRWFSLKAIDRAPPKDDVDRTGAFAVAADTAWWLAVHKIINEVEAETVKFARDRLKDTNACIAAVGAGEGVALVRQRLIETRQHALSSARQDSQAVKSAWD